MIFVCPICNKSLSLTNENRSAICENGHCFDFAKEGYLYLLPPNKKHSKSPGDDKQMVAARRRFLEAGYYGLFSSALNRLAEKYLSGLKNPVVLDAGCGEGYYTGRLFRFLSEHSLNPEAYGFDISKTAVRLAAKKYREISFAAASMFDIPVLSGSADLVTDVFAPIVPSELNRVLRPGGVMILAVPGKRHLYGLKQILYDEPYENETRETEYPGFRFQERVPVEGKLCTEDPGVMRDLFAMTPYFWKTPKGGCERLEKAGKLETEIRFDFLIYRKAAEA